MKEDIDWILNRGLDFGKIENKTVLIAGANSFLAAYMINVILFYNDAGKKQPCKILALVRNMKKAESKYGTYLKRKDFKLVKGDVCDTLDIHEKVDYIIHTASQASPKYYGSDPAGTFLPNVLGTYNLLELAKRNKSESFLFFSTSEVYGEPSAKINSFTETSFGYLDCMTTRACYGEGKRAGETLCKAYSVQYGINVKVVRPFHTYGPGMPLDDGRVYADFVKNVVEEKDVVLKSSGEAIRAFCYIRDAVDGFFRILFNGKSGEAYNIGSDIDIISIRKLADIVVSLFPEKKIAVKIEAGGNNEGYLKSPVIEVEPDISKARALGFDPETRIEEGFRRTILTYI